MAQKSFISPIASNLVFVGLFRFFKDNVCDKTLVYCDKKVQNLFLALNMKNLIFYRVVRMVERQVLVENTCIPKMLQLVMAKKFYSTEYR